MEALITSTLVVALGEIGDKTQLLAIVLASRFRQPIPIIFGIFLATLCNHFFAALVGEQAASLLDGVWFRYAVALSFIAMAFWTLIPDKYDEEKGNKSNNLGAFTTTLFTFFFVEMGDKTQIATVALGARFHEVLPVMTGSTLGMLIADVPAVFLSAELIKRVPLRIIRSVAAVLFLAIGVWLLLQTAGWI